MAQSPFKKGDIVRLKSGGPKMTVADVVDAEAGVSVWCIWFEGGVTRKEGHFPAEALKVAAS